ncbi:MAG TPA: PQQ-dependent sugar dehydrogenase, partial [Fibrobacteria bacterium]|nr:PQQ-dependent sugar dehydrogenase [Fibrobacteria bacterium]
MERVTEPESKGGTKGRKRWMTGIWPACVMAGFLIAPAHAQTCADPKPENFKVNSLVTSGLRYPVHLAVAPDGRVFIADMNSGEIRLWKPTTTTTVVAGTVPTRFDNEDGFLGIALSPRFEQNGFLFAFFTTTDKVNRAHVLMRYKVNGDAVDIASGVELLRIPRVANGRYHAGGGMAWNAQGDLLIGTGDDTDPHGAPNDGFGPIYWKEPGKDAQKSAANT